MATDSNTKPFSSLNVLLTALYPRPECCIDTEEYGTFVLQGMRLSNGDIQMVVESLSTLQYNNNMHSANTKTTNTNTNATTSDHTNDDVEWKRVALWSSSSTLTTIPPVAQTMKSIPGLKERLQAALLDDDHDDHDDDDDDDDEPPRKRAKQADPAHRFLHSARTVFQELLDALSSAAQEQQHSIALSSSRSRTTVPSNPHGRWNSTHLMELHHQLEELESNYFPDAIDLHPDFSNLSLQTTDEAQRVHTIVLDLTQFPNNNATIAIKEWHIPNSKDATLHHHHHDDDDDDDSRYNSSKTRRQHQQQRRTTKEMAITSKPPHAAATLSDIYDHFDKIVQDRNSQDLWNQLDDIDARTWVLLQQEGATANRSNFQRRICLRAPSSERHSREEEGDDDDDDTTSNRTMDGIPTTIVLTLNQTHPRHRPANIHILGGSQNSRVQRKATLDAYSWNVSLMVRNNLERCFGASSLAKPKEDNKNNSNDRDDPSSTTNNKNTDLLMDCGICFSACTSTTYRSSSSSSKCYHCENPKCARPYHTACLAKWLASVSTSRVSFDFLLGECPYCKDAIAVQQQDLNDDDDDDGDQA